MTQRLLGNDIGVEEALRSFVDRPPTDRDEARQLEAWVDAFLLFWPYNYKKEHNECWELALRVLGVLHNRRGMGPDLQGLYAQLLDAALKITEASLEAEDAESVMEVTSTAFVIDIPHQRIVPLSADTLDRYINSAYLQAADLWRLRDRLYRVMGRVAARKNTDTRNVVACMLRGMIARSNAVTSPEGQRWTHRRHFEVDCRAYNIDPEGSLLPDRSESPVFAPGT